MKNAILLLAVVSLSVIFTASTQAALVASGSVVPFDMTTWTSITDVSIGDTADGSILVNHGSTAVSRDAELGQTGCIGSAMVTGTNSRWSNTWSIFVGYDGAGELNIYNSGTVYNAYGGYVGDRPGSSGTANVDGADSIWENNRALHVGYYGIGELNITAGGRVTNMDGFIGTFVGSLTTETSSATVAGKDSRWASSGALYVGHSVAGVLDISSGGLVSVAGTLTIDNNGDGDGFINMSSGGMLALYDSGWTAGDDIYDFLDLVNGTDEIRYWDGSGWDHITHATYGVDYSLEHQTNGDLADYTVLAVGVPEPATLGLLAAAGLALVIRRRSLI